MNPPNPPLPASRGSLTAAAAAGYSPAAPGYRPRPAEGLVRGPAYHGYPGTLDLPNAAGRQRHPYAAGCRGPAYSYAAPGLPGAAGFPGSYSYDAPGFPGTFSYAAPGLPDGAGFSGAYAAPGLPLRGPYGAGYAYAPPGLPDGAGFSGAYSSPGLPLRGPYGAGYAYAPPGLPDGAGFSGAYSSPGLPLRGAYGAGYAYAPPGHDGLGNNGDCSLWRHPSGGLNAGALSFERHQESRQDTGDPSCSQSLRPHHLHGPFPRIREANVRQIWRYNCLEAFQDIKELIMASRKGRLFIAIDLEYLADASTDTSFRPNTTEEWYTYLQQYVNNGTVAQIGLAIASEEEAGEVLAYEFNLVVDVEKGNYNEASVKFLEKHKHNLSKNREFGILPEWISAALFRYLPFGNRKVVWIAYHGDKDIGFFLRLSEGGGSRAALPPLLGSFFHQFKQKFPHYYDVRVLAQMVKKDFHGKLTALAGEECLNLKRIGGEHHAGSDAVLTLQCFGEILQRNSLEGIIAREGLLSGIEELQLCIKCYRPVTATNVNVVEVYQDNFELEAAYISQTITNNFNIIGLQVVTPQVLDSIEEDYPALRSHVSKLDCFEVLLTFMNAEGALAYGRAWHFFLKVGEGDKSRVNPIRLAALLASSGSTHDDKSVWVTYGAEYGLACLMQAFISPGNLPLSLVKYKLARSTVFLQVYDVKVLAEVFLDLEVSGDVAEAASLLGVTADACNAVTILRCFYSLGDRVHKDEDCV